MEQTKVEATCKLEKDEVERMDKLKYICETETIETPQTYRSFLYSHSEGIYSIPEDDYLLDPVKTKTAIENRK